MTPYTLALEACRLLVESYTPERGVYALSELAQAREKARRALEAAERGDDPTTLNIGGGER